MAADLVHEQVAVLVTTGGEPTSVSAKEATYLPLLNSRDQMLDATAPVPGLIDSLPNQQAEDVQA